jgi:hypothetical protein
MRGKQCKCKTFNAKASLSLRQLRLVPKVGKMGLIKFTKGTKE